MISNTCIHNRIWMGSESIPNSTCKNKSVISMPIKDFIHHYPITHFYNIPRSGRSFTTYPKGPGNMVNSTRTIIRSPQSTYDYRLQQTWRIFTNYKSTGYNVWKTYPPKNCMLLPDHIVWNITHETTWGNQTPMIWMHTGITCKTHTRYIQQSTKKYYEHKQINWENTWM